MSRGPGTLARQVHRLAEAQNWRCCYCGFRMLSPHPRREEIAAVVGGTGRRRRFAIMYRIATREHVVPRCDGGTEALDNLVAACRLCNEFRGNRPAEIGFSRILRLLRRRSHPHQVWEASGFFPRAPGLRNAEQIKAGT